MTPDERAGEESEILLSQIAAQVSRSSFPWVAHFGGVYSAEQSLSTSPDARRLYDIYFATSGEGSAPAPAHGVRRPTASTFLIRAVTAHSLAMRALMTFVDAG